VRYLLIYERKSKVNKPVFFISGFCFLRVIVDAIALKLLAISVLAAAELSGFPWLIALNTVL
jgi:hypothetical protein